MEFHTNENCCLVDQVINNQTQKYDILSRENVDLHNILIKSKDTIIQMETIITNLRNILRIERETNLQLYIQEQTYHLQRGWRGPTNPELTGCHDNKLSSKRGTTESSEDKAHYALVLKYNELLKLLDQNRHAFQGDLDLCQSLNVKYNTKLKAELSEMHDHISYKFDLYKSLQNDLFNTRKENIKCRKELQTAIKALNLEQATKVNNMKKSIMLEAVNTASINARETVNIMKIQLGERDKLVTKLRAEQVKIEAYVEKQEQEFQKQLQKHKQAIEESKKQLSYSEDKYHKLELHRLQECQGIPIEIANIRKTIKEIKGKLCSKEHKCNKIYLKKVELVHSLDT